MFPTRPQNRTRHVARRLHSIADEADRLVRSMLATPPHRFDATRRELEHQLRRMRLQVADLDDSLRYGTRRALRRADSAIHENPYPVVGIAAAAAALLALAFARR